MDFPTRFDVIVIGGGHAGTEAALAAARMGSSTLLLTHNIETLGQMSCNPAIGGIGKTHLVKEIDALGGVMAHAADQAGIHFRVLNARKGPAVRATRAQTDRQLYKAAIRGYLEQQPKLTIFQQAVAELLIKGEKIQGVSTQMGVKFYAPTVVLSTGTFLGGCIHIGLNNYAGGRAGDPPATALAQQLRELPITVGRLKTGTPARLDGRSLNYQVMEQQPGDNPLPVMSYQGSVAEHPHQVVCHITRTNSRTHEIIHNNLERSPIYGGHIESVGPRYCPSIEDKIVRFADKASHQIFIEPEGLNTCECYPNGISTSLPFDVQYDFIRSIKGFEQAHITRPGYAIEYDYFDPRGLKASLESKYLAGLFFAGQINGTTGYEEAAAQGLLAGVNAALQAQKRSPWWPERDQAYLGVLVDDLISCGAPEPYRMFTSRAEYRLLLRQDNADWRLTAIGHQLGLVDEQRWQQFCAKKEGVIQEQQRLQTTWIRPQQPVAQGLQAYCKQPINREYNLTELLRRPEMNYQRIKEITGQGVDDPAVAEQVEIQVKYAGYIDRQQQDIERLKHYQQTPLPDNFDYHQVVGLSNEVKQALSQAKPDSLARAARIPGVTPAAISILLVYLKRHYTQLKANQSLKVA